MTLRENIQEAAKMLSNVARLGGKGVEEKGDCHCKRARKFDFKWDSTQALETL